MQSVNLIVSCTNRKRVLPPEDLCLRSLKCESVSRLDQWVERLSMHPGSPRAASDLYAGDHWKVAQAIPKEASKGNVQVRLWVCSAGYGLIRSSDMIKPYSATFTPGHPDSVLTPESNPRDISVVQEWWAGLCDRSSPTTVPHSIADLAACDPQVPMVIVAAEPYILAMSPDIVRAAEILDRKEFLSILSISTSSKRLPELKANLLPADARFEAVVSGARASLNVRVARLLFRHFPKDTVHTQKRFSSMLLQFAKDLPPLRSFNRRKMTDKELRSFVDHERKADPGVSKTNLLRQLRVSGAACEQKRFSEIFHRNVEGLSDDT